MPGWPGFERLSSLREELEKLFESPLAELARPPQLFGGWMPVIDLYEDKDNFTLNAELPGMKKEDINISLGDGVLTIAGERKPDKKYETAEACRAERFFGKFHRSVALPKPVAADKVTAVYKDGILTVTLPKIEEVKPRQIEVNVK